MNLEVPPSPTTPPPPHVARYTLYIIGYTLYGMRCTLYTIRYTLYVILHTSCAIPYTLYATRYTLYATRYTRCTLHATRHTVYGKSGISRRGGGARGFPQVRQNSRETHRSFSLHRGLPDRLPDPVDSPRSSSFPAQKGARSCNIRYTLYVIRYTLYA